MTAEVPIVALAATKAIPPNGAVQCCTYVLRVMLSEFSDHAGGSGARLYKDELLTIMGEGNAFIHARHALCLKVI